MCGFLLSHRTHSLKETDQTCRLTDRQWCCSGSTPRWGTQQYRGLKNTWNDLTASHALLCLSLLMFALPAAHQLGHKSLLLVLLVALSASEIRCDKSKIKAQRSQFEFVPQKEDTYTMCSTLRHIKECKLWLSPFSNYAAVQRKRLLQRRKSLTRPPPRRYMDGLLILFICGRSESL